MPRLGVMHSVVFAGFSASAPRARVEDAEAKLVMTTDGQYRRGTSASLKEAVDEAVDGQGPHARSTSPAVRRAALFRELSAFLTALENELARHDDPEVRTMIRT